MVRGTQYRGPHPFGKPDRGLEYSRASQDYWEVRERYLRRFLEPVLKQEPTPSQTRESSPITSNEVSVAESRLTMLHAAREAVITRARNAATTGILQAETARVIKLTLDISALKDQYHQRAAIILLLDLF